MSGLPPSEVRRTAAMTVLTVTAGAVDEVSFLTLGKVFCALVTGNVLFVPGVKGDVPVARAAAAVAAFPAGAAPGAPALAGLAARGCPPGARSDSPRHASRAPAGMNRAPRRGHRASPSVRRPPALGVEAGRFPYAPRAPGHGVPRGTSAGYAAAQSAQVPKISTVWATLT
ncbi:DUF1275 family protein [Streptomyces sp. OS603R]|uniref:DUF1275 family protein n=1 Tax=Streptomyces sp. OS603R TaxID=3035287 RepID=UPI002435D555|nr:DUF1275 family protein [Streptomyces sp. OS603R]